MAERLELTRTVDVGPGLAQVRYCWSRRTETLRIDKILQYYEPATGRHSVVTEGRWIRKDGHPYERRGRAEVTWDLVENELPSWVAAHVVDPAALLRGDHDARLAEVTAEVEALRAEAEELRWAASAAQNQADDYRGRVAEGDRAAAAASALQDEADAARRERDAALVERDALRELAEWLVSMDSDDPFSPGRMDRITVTLGKICDRARAALAAHPARGEAGDE